MNPVIRVSLCLFAVFVGVGAVCDSSCPVERAEVERQHADGAVFLSRRDSSQDRVPVKLDSVSKTSFLLAAFGVGVSLLPLLVASCGKKKAKSDAKKKKTQDESEKGSEKPSEKDSEKGSEKAPYIPQPQQENLQWPAEDPNVWPVPQQRGTPVAGQRMAENVALHDLEHRPDKVPQRHMTILDYEPAVPTDILYNPPPLKDGRAQSPVPCFSPQGDRKMSADDFGPAMGTHQLHNPPPLRQSADPIPASLVSGKQPAPKMPGSASSTTTKSKSKSKSIKSAADPGSGMDTRQMLAPPK